MFKNYSIDKLTAASYPEIISVWEASVRATHDFLNEEDIQAYKSMMNGQYFDRLRLFGVYGEKGEIEGFIGIQEAKIQLLFILPACRGKGIGKALINYGYLHMDIREVDVNEQNTSAFDFYTYLGFEVTDRSTSDATGKPFPVLSMELR
jgi:putative acetyltransferase